MFEFNVYVVVAALVGLLVFLRLGVAWKVLISFFFMSHCFDLLPQIVLGSFVWDAGAILLLISAVQLMFTKPKEPKIRAISVTLLRVFFIWMILCLVYSLLVYGYPLLNTLKVSRELIIGYMSFFVFLKLFLVDKDALAKLIKWLYVATYLLMLMAIVQYVISTPILPGFSESTAQVNYRGALRYIPVFLPISLFNLWVILSKYFQGENVKLHEWVYGVMALILVSLTYTRGIYIAVLVSFQVMLFLLMVRGRLKATSVVMFFVVASLGLSTLIAGGWMDRVVSRVASGVELVTAASAKGSKADEDTFSGRLLLVQERFSLVSERNPVVGFGFMHENDFPDAMRNKLKYGSVASTPEMIELYGHGHPFVLSLYSADIGWGDIALKTGFVGFFLFLLFVAVFLRSFKKMKNDYPPLSHYRLAFFIQTIVLLLLMFNGDTFTHNVQIAAFMIAGYCYVSRPQIEMRQPAESSLPEGQ